MYVYGNDIKNIFQFIKSVMTTYLIVQKDGNIKETTVKQFVEEDL